MKTALKTRSARKAPFVFGLALSCSFMAGSADAQWIVSDPTHMAQSVLQKVQDAAHYAKEVTHQVNEVTHMTQQLTDVSMILDSAKLTASQTFKKRSPMDGISDRCGGGLGGMMSDFMSSISLSGEEDIVQQQKMICKHIVMLENQKYNDQVDYLNEVIASMQRDIDRAKKQAKEANTNGKENSNAVNLELNHVQHRMNSETEQKRAAAFQEMINALETQQKNLARIAMNGKTSVVGTIANTLILKAALKVNE